MAPRLGGNKVGPGRAPCGGLLYANPVGERRRGGWGDPRVDESEEEGGDVVANEKPRICGNMPESFGVWDCAASGWAGWGWDGWGWAGSGWAGCAPGIGGRCMRAAVVQPGSPEFCGWRALRCARLRDQQPLVGALIGHLVGHLGAGRRGGRVGGSGRRCAHGTRGPSSRSGRRVCGAQPAESTADFLGEGRPSGPTWRCTLAGRAAPTLGRGGWLAGRPPGHGGSRLGPGAFGSVRGVRARGALGRRCAGG